MKAILTGIIKRLKHQNDARNEYETVDSEDLCSPSPVDELIPGDASLPSSGSVNPNIRNEQGSCGQLRFKSNYLQWPVTRQNRSFRAYIVEPKKYQPEEHAGIFNAALMSLVSSEHSHVDSFSASAVEAVEPFDLVTFPEAFLPVDDLLMVLQNVKVLGCVHVGLRPSDTADQHLFSVAELLQLVESLLSISEVVSEDLSPFFEWLQVQSKARLFNVACLFTIDAHQKVRVCLHPKIVRSKYEISPLQEGNMVEADLLTLVTLLPEDKTLLSVTLQPLICADALPIETDRPNCRPLEAITSDACCLKGTPPDHVDIVSVSTCTPQPVDGELYRQWHQQFRNSFVRAASDDLLTRHHYATFLLSNFSIVPGPLPGGLSGAFIPIPPQRTTYPPFVTLAAWGRLENSQGSDNCWFRPIDKDKLGEQWSSLGHIASIDSGINDDSTVACMLGFTIHRLPRDTTRWPHNNCLKDFQLQKATYDADLGKVVFRKEGSHV